MHRFTVIPAGLALLLGVCGLATGQPYTVSGQVMWHGIGPVPDARVSVTYYLLASPFPRTAGQGVTDQTGHFKFVVDFGPYNPISMTISGYRAVSGVEKPIAFGTSFNHTVFNFTVNPPAILVHDLFDDESAWGAAKQRLDWSNIPYRSVNLSQSWTRSHVDNAKLLDAEINTIRASIYKDLGLAETPMEMDLVGHGSGGLVSRAYVANHTGRTGENRVRRCVTLASPHLGAAWLWALPMNHPYFLNSRCLFEMRVDYMLFLFPAELRGGYGDTRFYLMGSSLNLNSQEPELIPGWPFSRDDDMFISTFSATDKSWGGKVDATATEAFAHDKAIEKCAGQVAFWLWQP